MAHEININTLQSTQIGKHLLKVDKNDQLAKVGLVGRIVLWIKSLASKKAFNHCKITAIATVLQKMMESNQLTPDQIKVIEGKFNEILDKKSLKATNRATILPICHKFFPSLGGLDPAEKIRIAQLAEKVASEGFAAMPVASDSELKAVVDELALQKKLNNCHSRNDDDASIIIQPLLHTAIKSLDNLQAQLVVSYMVEKGADLNSFTIDGSKQMHALVLAENKDYQQLKNYIETELKLTEIQKKDIYRKAEGSPVLFEETFKNLNSFSVSILNKNIEELAQNGQINAVKSICFEDGSEKQHTLLTYALTILSGEKRWQVVNQLIANGADCLPKLTKKSADGEEKSHGVASKFLQKTLQEDMDTFADDELRSRITFFAKADLINAMFVANKNGQPEGRTLITNAVLELSGERRKEVVDLLLQKNANPKTTYMNSLIETHVNDDQYLRDWLTLEGGENTPFSKKVKEASLRKK